MNFQAFLTIPTLAVLLSACSTTSNSILTRSGFRVSMGATPPKQAKIFLIAGSQDSANFAQEVIDQKKFWIAQGYSSEEIVCYYTPMVEREKNDEVQFNELFRELRDCYLADPKIIYAHISAVAQSNPSSLYIYVSSHGSKPFSKTTYTFQKDSDREKFARILALPKWSDTYYISTEGMAEGGYTDFWTITDFGKLWNYALDNPERADQFMFTPRGLKNAMNALNTQTKKFIVLQGCHTGGFILPADKVGAENTLEGIENSVVMTASRSDRTSFGCDQGSHTTYFGEAYMRSLKKFASGKKLEQINWKEVYDMTEEIIRQKEISVGRAKNDLSQPQYYNNI